MVHGTLIIVVLQQQYSNKWRKSDKAFGNLCLAGRLSCLCVNVILVCVWECHLYNGESFHLINLVSPPPPPSLLSPRHSCLFLLCSIITPLSLHRRRRSSSAVFGVSSNGLLFGSSHHLFLPVLSYPITRRALERFHFRCPQITTHARDSPRRGRGVLLLLGGVTIRTLHTLTRFALFYEREGYILSLRDSFFWMHNYSNTNAKKCLHSHYSSLSSPKLSGSG